MDKEVNKFTKKHENNFAINFAKFYSNIFHPITFGIISLGIIIFLIKKNEKRYFLLFISLIILALVITNILKLIFKRNRPKNEIVQEKFASMPSSHAAIAIVFFGFISFYLIKNFNINSIITIISCTILILLMGFSRIYLRVHWLTDVIIGYLIGGLILTAGIILF